METIMKVVKGGGTCAGSGGDSCGCCGKGVNVNEDGGCCEGGDENVMKVAEMVVEVMEEMTVVVIGELMMEDLVDLLASTGCWIFTPYSGLFFLFVSSPHLRDPKLRSSLCFTVEHLDPAGDETRRLQQW